MFLLCEVCDGMGARVTRTALDKNDHKYRWV